MSSATMEALLSSPAFIHLAEQVEAGNIPSDRADYLRTKFAELTRAASVMTEKEKDATMKVKELKTLVRDEAISLEKARLKRDQLKASNETAEAEAKKLASTLTELEAKAVSLQQDGNELRLRETELAEDVAKLKEDNEKNVQPVLQQMAQDISDSKAETARAAAQVEQLTSTKKELAIRVAELEKAVTMSQTNAGTLKSELSRVKDEPERAMKALEGVRRALHGVTEEINRLRAALDAREAEMQEQEAAAAELTRVRKELESKMLKYRDEMSQRETEVDKIDKTLKVERAQYKDLLERRIELQAEQASALAGARIAENERDAAAAAYERGKRELKRKNDAIAAANAALPEIETLVRDRELELTALQREQRDLDAAEKSYKRDIDTLMQAFLKEEGIEKRIREKMGELVERAKGIEAEKEAWHKEEMTAHKQIAALKAQRDNKSREVTRLVESRKVAIEGSKLKELYLIDLTKQLADINGRLKQFAAMYEVVKTERNAFANNIQSASQSIAEMRERIKILHNEVDILKNESSAKDKALAKERQAHALASVQRDALRAEANKAAAIYKDKQSAVESQVMAIDKMNAIINSLEREMIALKKQYESAVETRNYTGIQLIDRNDELCILYEKANIHDKTLGEGEKALRVMTEEIRSLKLSIGEVERQLHLAKVHYPETPLWAERILELQKQLVQARQVTEKLCASLEAPGAKDRWVELGGEDPDEDVLNERFEALEARVNGAREELLEKELVLEEISSLTARLKAAATNAGGTGAKTGPGGTAMDAPAVAAAKQATELQSKIKEVNRKMMAVVSELSMYQATAIKLAAESNTAAEALSKAEDAAAKGLPPSVTAEQRWQSIVKAMQAGMPSAGGLTGTALPAGTTLLPDGARTTAEVRPNAYIPEGIGLPKPYGEFAPFKPQLGGSQMRHFRPPEVKEIEI